MLTQKSILKSPKIKFKIPKKIPTYLNINNNMLNIDNNNYKVSKRQDTISTNESINNFDDVNILDESFDMEEQNVNEQYNNNIDVLCIIKKLENKRNKID
jgi:hypothetical protein